MGTDSIQPIRLARGRRFVGCYLVLRTLQRGERLAAVVRGHACRVRALTALVEAARSNCARCDPHFEQCLEVVAVTEHLHDRRGPFVGYYEETKCGGEWLGHDFCASPGIDDQILRPSIVVDPRGTSAAGSGIQHPTTHDTITARDLERSR